MAIELMDSAGRPALRPKRNPTAVEARLPVLLLEPPGRQRDGRQLQLELDGYDVTASWEPEAVLGGRDPAFIYLVLSTEAEARRWDWLTERSKAPIVVIWSRSPADLAVAGFRLRGCDFCSRGASGAGNPSQSAPGLAPTSAGPSAPLTAARS